MSTDTDVGSGGARRGRQLYRTLARELPNVALVVFDHDLRILVAEGEALLSHGMSDLDAEGRLLPDVMEPRTFASLQRAYRSALKGQRNECRQTSPDGSRHFHVVVKPLVDEADGVWAALALAQDVTKLRVTEERLLQRTARLATLAHNDELTGLPNRTLFRARLRRAMADAKRDGRDVALIFVDLDGFKDINDSFGHEAGDQVLKGVGSLLSGVVDVAGTVARLGGDEFALVVEDTGDGTEPLATVERVFTALEAPIATLDSELFVTASVGIALAPQDGASVDALLTAAERAAHSAKPGGNDHRFFHPRMHELARERWTIQTDLHRALRRDEFILHYQPAIDLQTGQVISVEALIRWQHPERGLLPPNDFIPIAERAGMASEITAWVLDHACREVQRWRDVGVPALRLAVNSCSRELGGGLTDLITKALEASGLPPECLEIEVTERFLGKDDDVRDDMLLGLKRLGVSIALDDFGTGYSSLARLRSFPVDVIKIDRSFIAELHETAAIAQTIIVLAANLGVQVIAEGVEHEHQLAWLKNTTCDAASGFFICRPQPADRIERWLRESPQGC